MAVTQNLLQALTNSLVLFFLCRVPNPLTIQTFPYKSAHNSLTVSQALF
jgi:hypothetical protein